MRRIATLTLALLPLLCVAETALQVGNWEARVADDSSLSFYYNGKEAFADVYSTTNYRSVADKTDVRNYDSRNLTPSKVEIVDIDDEFGKGKSLEITYPADGNQMVSRYSFYPHLDYFLAQVSLVSGSDSQVSANRMVPFSTETQSTMIEGAKNRILWVPFSNDNHVRYQVYELKRTVTSYEASAVFNQDSRFGLIAGSVDHDKWKSAIISRGTSSKYLASFQCLSGIADEGTQDYDTPHGYVYGSEVSSARFMIGFFDDWRIGMETFADACVTVAPRAVWEGGNPVGYSSWGNVMNYVSYTGIVETATFMKEQLEPHGFHGRDGRITISLDSFAELNMGDSNSSKMGNKVLGSGTYRDGRETKQGLDMNYGLYNGIVIWDWTVDEQVKGTGLQGNPVYHWRDCLLKCNGQPRHVFPHVQYLATDPTHPAVEANLRWQFERWAGWNVKYVKIDFIDAAICEGDSWYRPEITTGKMAYNYIMKIALELAEQYDMYMVQAMSPLFPYQYAHGRRTLCDRFSQLGESEYIMNAISWGWWTDRLYAVNDPDNCVFYRDKGMATETIGENRARATSCMCTGAYIFGDNFSDNCLYPQTENGHVAGTPVGYPAKSRERALEIMTNEDINAYVRENTGSFRPVLGNNYTASEQAERQFMRETDQYLYVAVFNWSLYMPTSGVVKWTDLGFDPSNAGEIKELWSGEIVDFTADGIPYSFEGGDAKVFRVTKKDYDSVESVVVDAAQSGPVEYYNLQGVRVPDDYQGICIRLQGGEATKVVK